MWGSKVDESAEKKVDGEETTSDVQKIKWKALPEEMWKACAVPQLNSAAQPRKGPKKGDVIPK